VDGHSPIILENILAGSKSKENFVLADAHGRFELQGLTDRSYDVVALDARRNRVRHQDPHALAAVRSEGSDASR
jgi:hypothetical protein